MKKSLFLLAISIAILYQCRPVGSNDVRIDDEPFGRLSDYNFFLGDLKDLRPNQGVLPYDLNSLFFLIMQKRPDLSGCLKDKAFSILWITSWTFLLAPPSLRTSIMITMKEVLKWVDEFSKTRIIDK